MQGRLILTEFCVPPFHSALIPSIGENFACRLHTDFTEESATIRMSAGDEDAARAQIIRIIRKTAPAMRGAVA